MIQYTALFITFFLGLVLGYGIRQLWKDVWADKKKETKDYKKRINWPGW